MSSRTATSFASSEISSNKVKSKKTPFPFEFSKQFNIIEEKGKVFSNVLLLNTYTVYDLQGYQAKVYKVEDKTTSELFDEKIYFSSDLEIIEKVSFNIFYYYL